MPNPKKTTTEKTEHVDPITGVIEELPLYVRYRLRDLYIDDLGREIPDPRPMAPPIGYKKQPSMVDLIREQVQREIMLHAVDREPEDLEESEDFNIDDDYDPTSPWENDFDPPFSEVRQAIEEDRAAKAAAAAPAAPKQPEAPAAAPPAVPGDTQGNP